MKIETYTTATHILQRRQVIEGMLRQIETMAAEHGDSYFFLVQPTGTRLGSAVVTQMKDFCRQILTEELEALKGSFEAL